MSQRISDHESPPSEDITCEQQIETHQFNDASEKGIDLILDYINSQNHHKEDMNHALQAYNVLTTTSQN